MGALFRALALVAALLVAFFAFTEASSPSVAQLVGGVAVALAFYFASTFDP